MLVSPELLRAHIGYTAWASGLAVEAAGRLTQAELTRDFGTADKRVLGTLVHVFGADRLWLARLKGEPATAFLTDEDYRLSVLQNDWPALYRQWKEWATGLTDEAAQEEVSLCRHARQPLASATRPAGAARREPRDAPSGPGIGIFARHGTRAAQAGSGLFLSCGAGCANLQADCQSA